MSTKCLTRLLARWEATSETLVATATSRRRSKRITSNFVAGGRLRFTRHLSSQARRDISFPQELRPLGVESYEAALKMALEDTDKFWKTVAEARIKWQKPFTQVSDCDMFEGRFSWYKDGVLNVTETCVDKHLGKNKVALIWERDEPGQEVRITYEELHERMCRLANVLVNLGIQKGDRVIIYMPCCPDAVAAMLACARIGAIHSVVFAGFSVTSLSRRINTAEARVVITVDQSCRGGKCMNMKDLVDRAVADCPGVQKVLVSRRSSSSSLIPNRDLDLDDELAKVDAEREATPMKADDPLFMLFTSGSTGLPKGLVHASAGYLVYASLTHELVFSYADGDIHGCVADIGWITGHTYVVYGPLSNGATTLLFESTPNYPDFGRYWEMVQRLKITQFYTAPTAIRMLLKAGDDNVRRYDRSSLKVLGCVGEPLNHEAFEWYRDVVGEGTKDVVDTWWQTETGGILISPRPSPPGAPIYSSMPMRPFFGIEPVLTHVTEVDESEEEQCAEHSSLKWQSGELCISRPWPGLARTIWNNHDLYKKTYFSTTPGLYFCGDGARRDREGFYQITGRLDDIVNVTGHRLGTAEVENAINEHPDIAESAVVGIPHDIKGEVIFAFMVKKDNRPREQEELKREVASQVKKEIASYAVPAEMLLVPALPKTRSGKILRRFLRKIAVDDAEDFGDVSVVSDTWVLTAILDLKRKQAAEEKGKP